MTKAQAKRKLIQVAKLNNRPRSDFKVVRVIYTSGESGWDVTGRGRRNPIRKRRR